MFKLPTNSSCSKKRKHRAGRQRRERIALAQFRDKERIKESEQAQDLTTKDNHIDNPLAGFSKYFESLLEKAEQLINGSGL